MNTNLTAPTLDHMEFLSWVGRALFFPGDLITQLKSLGVSEEDARVFAYSDAVRCGNVLNLFEDYGRAEAELFKLFLADCWTQWIATSAKQASLAVAYPTASSR
jgi:hypothetical protein